MKVDLGRLRRLREIGVSRATFDEKGQVDHVEFFPLSDEATALKAAVERLDAEEPDLAPEERLEKLLYGHTRGT